jgi:nickel-dependent lactate racemase
MLSEAAIQSTVAAALDHMRPEGRRILVLIPDGTRSGPTAQMCAILRDQLAGRARRLDFLIALGTHPPLDDGAIERLAGGRMDVHNHAWDREETFATLGEIPAGELREISGGLLDEPLPVRINRMVLEADVALVCGPVFPHEVVGYSGGNKYFFPGVSGPEVINVSHWLGALLTSYAVIGVKHTPVRRLIDRAAALIPVPRYCLAMVVEDGGLAGLYHGTPEDAWSRAADLSAERHVTWLDRPVRRVLSVMPPRYGDLWTAAKGMYKVEPVVAPGGEVILYAPRLREISRTHGALLEETGYHVRDYFLEQWPRFSRYPRGVLAHATHLRGIGAYDPVTGVETPRVRVTLATGIPRATCERVNLGYLDPASVRLDVWRGREGEGILLVENAGERLYRLKERRV